MPQGLPNLVEMALIGPFPLLGPQLAERLAAAGITTQVQAEVKADILFHFILLFHYERLDRSM